MGSRRATPHSPSGNGSSRGNNVNGNNRPGGCSYLSNVRPENRSTLCSVIAQLTEETQPSFETTLRSRAVSENSTVKFSCVVTGYPAPLITWYKDDLQMDRYCGLPKYEIFRNGKNHSLHIYKCTMEDAAIYQASAINSKGIVSCSGVLEVGEMNEFKIHQRYFAKLKLKAENKCKEVKGKENQEPLRTISPDRTQRKRRSTMEAFISTPSSLEDEDNEESNQMVTLETETGLQLASVEEGKEPSVPVPIVNGIDPDLTNGLAISNHDSKGDLSQKISITHQTKPPFIKKKIKISTDAKVPKPDSLKEKMAKEELSLSAAPASTEKAKNKKNPPEVMEVETINKIPIMDLKTKTDKHSSLAKEEVLLPERSLKDDSMYPVKMVTLQKEQILAPSKTPATSMTASPAVKASESKKASNNVREARHTEAKGKFKTQNKFINENPTQPQGIETSRSHSTLQMNNKGKKHNADTDVDMESKASPEEPVSPKRSQPVFPPHNNRGALPQRLGEATRDQSSEWKTSPGQKKVPVSPSTTPAEVAQANAKKNRNNAAVSPEIPPRRRTFISQTGRKTQTERETPTGGTQTSSLVILGKARKDAQDYSSKSSEKPTSGFADTQKATIKRSGEGEKSQECSISPKISQRQVDAPVKTTEGQRIQNVNEKVDEKVEKKEEVTLQIQEVKASPDEKIVVMETEHAAFNTTELNPTEKIKNTNVSDVPVSSTETDKDQTVSKEEDRPEILNKELDKVDTSHPLQQKTPENLDSKQIVDPQEKLMSAKQIISIAELLRSQIKALESTLVNSALIIPTQAHMTHEQTSPVTRRCSDLEEHHPKSKDEERISAADRKTQTRTEDIPPPTIKAILMEIYNQLNISQQEQILCKNETFQSDEALPQPANITVPDRDIDMDTNKHSRSGDECVMETVQEPKVTTVITCKDSSVQQENTLVTTKIKSISNVSTPENQKSQESKTSTRVAVLESNPAVSNQTTKESDMGSIDKLDPKNTNNLMEMCSTEKTVTPISEQCNNGEQDHPDQSDSGTSRTDQHLHNNNQDKLNPNITLTPEPSPVLKRRSSTSPIPSATPQELATGARRKIIAPKSKSEEVPEVTLPTCPPIEKKEVPTQSNTLSTTSITPSVSPSVSRKSSVLQPAGELSPAVERRSPMVSRKKTTMETQSPKVQPDENQTEGKPGKHNPFKAPQVIRKIRGEIIGDTSGHLKLWCQFFNVLSDSTIKWFRNEEEIAQSKRNAGDETQVNLAIVQASCRDSGVYGCSITNEYGSDTTDILLSADILAGFSLREDLGVGEEIEMTPLMFSRGVADSGVWGNKFFGRVMMKETHVGEGFSHKVWRAKVIYGLEPVFESGNICIIKVRNPIIYGGKVESSLIERNLEMVKQDCKIQNLAREYCKIFSAEARVIENFGRCLEVMPVYLMYRPANTIPYATVETDLTGNYQKYSMLDHTGRMELRCTSEVEQKCSALQHWIFQWTNGNLLFTRLEGVDMKITNVGISVKSTGYQGLSVESNPKVFEHFISQHKCNYFCGLLSLRSLKVMDSLMTPSKSKSSKSPLLQRKMAGGSSSPQSSRKAGGSPRLSKKSEQDDSKVAAQQKSTDAPQEVNMVE